MGKIPFTISYYNIMAKEREGKEKSGMKAPAKNLKEKRAAKAEKKANKSRD